MIERLRNEPVLIGVLLILVIRWTGNDPDLIRLIIESLVYGLLGGVVRSQVTPERKVLERELEAFTFGHDRGSGS